MLHFVDLQEVQRRRNVVRASKFASMSFEFQAMSPRFAIDCTVGIQWFGGFIPVEIDGSEYS
jgi:hypothetical protein